MILAVRKSGLLVALLGFLPVPFLWPAAPARGADFHLSPSGDDGRNCRSADQACRTLHRCAEAMSGAGPGPHTCYLASGTYRSPESGADTINHGPPSEGERWTFRAAPGATVDCVTGHFSHAAIRIEGNVRFVTVSDLRIHGGLYLGQDGSPLTGVDHLILERNRFICAAGVGSFNDIMLMSAWLYGSEPLDERWHDGGIVRENHFLQDESCKDGGSYGYVGLGANGEYGGEHPDGAHLYSVRNWVIEHNDFDFSRWPKTYQSGSWGTYAFWFKGPNTGCEFRENYVRGAPQSDAVGILVGVNDVNGTTAVHHNVLDSAGGLEIGNNVQVNGRVFYNNTVYNSAASCVSIYTQVGARHNELFNNLCLGNPRQFGGYARRYVNNSDPPDIASMCFQRFLGHNLYSPATLAVNFSTDRRDSATLADWQSDLAGLCGADALVRDQGSRAVADPASVLADPAHGDFRPRAASPAMSGGRGGNWPDYIGAYAGPRDGRQIGCSFDPRCRAHGIVPPTPKPTVSPTPSPDPSVSTAVDSGCRAEGAGTALYWLALFFIGGRRRRG